MKIICSADNQEMDHQGCLNCALMGSPPCGYDYALLKALYGGDQKEDRRKEIHVTDLTGCLRKAYLDKVGPAAERPHEMITRWMGSALHAYAEGSDEWLESELAIGACGITGKADIVYRSGRVVDYKCQPAGELVTMADGTEVKIEDVHIFEQVLSWDGRQYVSARVTAILDGGFQEVFEIHIASGQVIRVSGNHPILTDRGFVPAKDLIVKEDRAIVLSNWNATGTLSLEDARLIGYLNGDGSTSRKYGIGWTNKDEELIEDFRQIIENKGWDFHSATQKHENNLDWRITNRGLKQSTTGPMEFIRQYGLHGKKSYEKTIPNSVMSAGLDAVVNYIAGHFDTDGTITNPQAIDRIPARLSITTTSKEMARQLSELLRRIGISNRIHVSPVGYGGRITRLGYIICVWQADMILRFGDLIPFICEKKRDRFNNWRSYLEQKLRKGGKNLRRIESVVSLGNMQTIGLEVENTHTYITNGVITHNSTRWLYPSKLPYGSHALQVNIYAWLLRKMGREVNQLQIQYIDMSGPTKCRKCRVSVRMFNGELKCPSCLQYVNGAHLGAVLVEVPLMEEREIEELVASRRDRLQLALALGEPPEREPGFLCAYCSHYEICQSELVE